ncbi:MAG: cell wall-binding repeat-containing protein [Coriobacteriia bacterium]|nr:cell wall-binding repeat-containing protein [Coriobacteriia bacterium]
MNRTRRFFSSLIVLVMLAATVPAGAAPNESVGPRWKAAPPSASRIAEELPWEGFKRVAGDNRFATAAAIARESYPGWTGAEHVIVASGDDRAAADPLAAAGLCWLYDAPLLLVSATRTPAETLQVLREIKSVNPGVMVHVVGGPTSIPDKRLGEMRAVVGKSQVERLPYGNRYETAANVMRRMRTVASAEGFDLPKIALIANGADPDKFFDALAMSTISSSIGAPILLVSKDKVPSETRNALTLFAPDTILVAGGKSTVAGVVVDSFKKVPYNAATTRLAGADRYDTAFVIAEYAVARDWLDWSRVLFAAKLPDALTGSGLSGVTGAFMLMVPGDRVSTSIAAFLESNMDNYTSGMVLGGSRSVTKSVYGDLRGFVDPNVDVVFRLGKVKAQAIDAYPTLDEHAAVGLWAWDQFGLNAVGTDVNVEWVNLSVDTRNSYLLGLGGGYAYPGEIWKMALHAEPWDALVPTPPRNLKYVKPGHQLRTTVEFSLGGTKKTAVVEFTVR